MAEALQPSRKARPTMTLLERLTKPQLLAKDLEQREQRTAATRSLVDDFLDEVRQNIKDLQPNPDSQRDGLLYGKKN